MRWILALVGIAILAALPLGVSLGYDEEGIRIVAVVWKLRFPLYPLPKKKKTRPQKQKKKTGSKQKAAPKAEAPKSGGSLTDFLPLLKVLWDFLGKFRRSLRVDLLEIRLMLAGDDPCDLAVNYGRAWAAVGNLMPRLEQLVTVKKRDVQVLCDFTAARTCVTARADMTIRLGSAVVIASELLFRGLKEYLKIMNKRKGGAVNESESS